MKYLERSLFKELQKWNARREIFAIRGPRQSGKTTLLEIYKNWLIENGVDKKNIISITFEDREVLEKFAQNPVDFVKRFITNKKQRIYFFIDEAQYLEALGQKLKLIYDKYPNIKLIITGSSSLELISQTAKYLVGRLFSFELLPLSFYEFLLSKDAALAKIYLERKQNVAKLIIEHKEFVLPKNDIFTNELLKYFREYLLFGSYPRVVTSTSTEEKTIVLKNIFNTYLEKDIVSFLQITDTAKFRKIVSILSAISGNLLSYEFLAANTNTYFKEIQYILDVLEQTYIISRLRPFHKNLVTELRKNPKIYFYDAGIRNYAIQNFSEFNVRADKAQLAENFVFNSLKTLDEAGNLYFWRTTAKAEVDFVINKGAIITPIEVKFEIFKKQKISKSFHSFISSYSPKIAIIATREFWGEHKIKKTKVIFLPLLYI